MKNSILLVGAIIIHNLSFAQIDSNEKAKLYFQEALTSFNQNNFEQALEYLDDVDQILGSTNSRVLNLRVKSLYNSGDFIEAEKALNLFINDYSESVTEELRLETLSYLVRIERAAEKQREEFKKEVLFNEFCSLLNFKGEYKWQAESGKWFATQYEITCKRDGAKFDLIDFRNGELANGIYDINFSNLSTNWDIKEINYGDKNYDRKVYQASVGGKKDSSSGWEFNVIYFDENYLSRIKKADDIHRKIRASFK